MLMVSRSRTQTVALAPIDPLLVSPSLEKQKKEKKGRKKKKDYVRLEKWLKRVR